MLLRFSRSLTVIRRFAHTYLFRMDKAYLRHLPETNQFQITFRYNNSDQKVDRQFNFSRLLTENTGAFLSRVGTNVEKIVNKKKKKKKAEDNSGEVTVEASLFLNGNKVGEEVVCKELFIDGNDVRMKVVEQEYQIVINSPYVDNIGLAETIMANFPTYPSKFDTVYTDMKSSEFVWYKSLDKKDWIRVGAGYVYTPGNAEIDHFLKLVCVPKNGGIEGPMVETISERKVAASAGVCPFESRHLFTKEWCKDNEFRIVSYNILADLYCDSDFTRSVLHPYCPPYALEIDYRKQLILKEILGYNADIICLQEVDRKVYNYDLNPVLSMLDYDSCFTLKGGSVAEGVACFYNNKRFKLLDQNGIVISEHIKTDPIFAEIWEKIALNEQLSERVLERQTAVQTTILKCENGNILLVGNTHLYFHPDADHIRLLQGSLCIKYIESVYKKLKETMSTRTISVIFCGDFNSVPECGIFKLYTTGTVGADCIDWKSNKEEAVIGLSVVQPFNLDSACGTPKYTNFTSGFADCLDYIFYDRDKLEVSQVIPLPSNEELTQHTALPSVVFPSDHISLVADLKWTK